ncbi:hypothetical protein ACFO4O_12420 [Glaciecola siphonariae]|uniref:Type I-F CRISPR-associated protein Csy1 n=1 Tax=Glaciecola siphonariae TaxID=521012 RepID=A0ABV9LXP6_9ALTE
MQIQINIPRTKFLEHLRMNDTLLKKKSDALEKALAKNSSLVETGESKIDDYVKTLYRNGVAVDVRSSSVQQDLNFWLHLSCVDALEKPELVLEESAVLLSFASYNGKSFPNNFAIPSNFSNRGFINTGDSSFLAEPIESSLKGISSSTLGLQTKTFSAVDGSNSKKYRHFNLFINDVSLFLHLKEKSELSRYISDSFIKLFGKEYCQDLSKYFTKPSEITYVDGLSKQINIPYNGGYISLSPVFNHNVLPRLNRLKYVKQKRAHLTSKNLGGTKPGNISYTALLEGGSLTSFNMSFPNKSSLNQRMEYLFATKGLMDLRGLKQQITTCVDLQTKEGINKVVNSLRSKIARQLVRFAKSQLSSLAHFEQDIQNDLVACLVAWQKSPKQEQMNLAEYHERLFDLIISNLKSYRQVDAQSLLTQEMNIAIRNEVISHG